MAARVEPQRVPTARQSLHHFVATTGWSDNAVLAAVRARATRYQQHGPMGALVIGDSAFPKKGRHSVSVAWQYRWQPGKEDNCRVEASCR